MLRAMSDGEKKRFESFDAAIKQTREKAKESKMPRGIMLSQIEELEYKKFLAQQSSDQLIAEMQHLEAQLISHDDGSTGLFCNTATIMLKKAINKKLCAIDEELAFRNEHEPQQSQSLK